MGDLIGVESIWEYQTTSNVIPGDPSSEVVPSAGWTAGGVAPFGTLGSLLVPYAINTAWATSTGLWIRRNFTTDGTRDVLIQGKVNDVAFVYIDGTYFAAINQTEDSRLADYITVIPKALLASGTHEIALLCFDVGGSTTYVYLEADLAPYFFPFQPKAPVKEELTWLTDVQMSKDGTEAREQMIVSPVQTLTYSYPLTAVRKSIGYHTAWSGVRKEWLVPVWSQARLHGAVTADQVTLTSVDTNYAEFRDASLVMLWESPDSYQILGIDLVQASSFTLVGLTQAFTNAWLVPIRQAFVPTDITKQHDGYEALFQIPFRIRDNKALTVAAPTQFLSEDIYTDVSLLAGDQTSDSIEGGLDIFDPGFGPIAFYEYWLNSRAAKSHRVVCESQEELWAYREFLHRRAGKFRAFYFPSFENDLRLVSTGTLTTVIQVQDDKYLAYAADRIHIAVESTSGWLFRTITSTADVGSGVTQLTLDTSLAIPANSVLRICWLGLHRLNADRVEIRYIGNNVSQSEVRILEIVP